MIGQISYYNPDNDNKKRRKKFLWLLLLLLLFIVVFVWFFWLSKNNDDKTTEKPKVQVQVGNPKESSNSKPSDVESENKVDQLVELPIIINTLGQTINAAEIHLIFNQDEIEIKEIVKSNSIFKYWIIQANEYDNVTGAVSLVGSLPSPGFKGIGNVAVLKAIPKKTGTIEILVAEATHVALNDGEGSITETVAINAKIEVK